jgi:5,10-methylene-tetrahydrofolate dehydrogenase/methenyl tetrahydrofolate cyclohydrolase
VRAIDILIVACGPPGALGGGHNKPGAALIDAGIMREANSKLAGSVDVAAEAAIS